MTSVFVSPHDDDQVLFGAFTLLREKPIVVIVYDSYVQPSRGLPGTEWHIRAAESEAACHILGCDDVRRLRFSDANNTVTASQIRSRLGEVAGGLADKVLYYPAQEVDGHAQHNLVSLACFRGMAAEDDREYLTYTRNGGKSAWGRPVEIEDPAWIRRKLQALAHFDSQFNLDPKMGCWPHFLRDQREYYV